MTNLTASRNPYIIGRPIDEPELFFGREGLFHFIEDNLRQDKKVILLYGQRRIGKSSLLRHIPKWVAPDQFVFVSFNLEYHSRESLSGILDALVTEIIDRLDLDVDKIKRPSTTELETEPYIFSSQFLPQIYEVLGGKKLVLLLDEFDALNNKSSDSAVEHLFPYLQLIVTRQDKLFIILLVGRQSADLPNLLPLFKDALTQEIGLLDEVSAKRLITKPTEGVLTYDPEALQAILELSAGHPYFTQIICFALFGRAREQQNWKVTREDVERIVDKAIELAEAGLAWFWDGLSIPERVVFSAVAEAQNTALKQAQRLPEEPLTLLNNYGVFQTELLVQAVKQLSAEGFLDSTGRRVKIELVRRWLVQRHPLRQEIWELEKLEQQQVNRLSEEAVKLPQQGNKRNALAIYEQILALNPNHFSTLFALAQGYLDVGDFSKAMELYTRADKVDPIRNKEGFLRALDTYAHKLISTWICQGYKDTPHQDTIVEKNRTCPKCNRAFNSSEYSNKYKRKPILLGAMAVAMGIAALVGVSFSRWSTSCLAGEKTVLGIRCVGEPSNISRGERTLFSFISNPQRDLGIEAFRKGNYPQAAKFFGRAVAEAPTDPEVLIYYNNARARKVGSPFTLAVVVSVDNESKLVGPQATLRGVAQAQNQFNGYGGLNGRFLEIAIANDNAGNEQYKAKKAQQVAQELVKDLSVLGVIGHDTSESSLAALPVYENAGLDENAALAMISPTSTSTWLSGNVFFRTVPSDASAGKKLADYTKNSLGLNNVMIFYNPANLYSNSLREAFRQNFQRLGGKEVGQSIDLTNPDLDAEKEVASRLQDKAQAALLFPNLEDRDKVLPIAKAIAKVNANLPQGQRLKLLGGDALYTLYSNKTLKCQTGDVEGLVLAVPWFAESKQSINFSEAAKRQWGQGKPIHWLTATSFDATQAFIKAIKALPANPTRSTVLQRLRQVNLGSSETSGEALKFTLEGNRTSEPILIKLVRGKFTDVKEEQ